MATAISIRKAKKSNVPPLEDMSTLLHQVQNMKDNTKSNRPNNSPANPSHLNNANSQQKPVNVRRQENRSLSTNNRVSSSTNNNNVVAATGGATADARPKESAGFGGLKQGFLVNTTNPKDNDKRTNETRNLTERNICGSKKIYNKDMPFIKAKHESRDRNLEFPEVQQAMKLDGNVLKNKDWVTDNLLQKIEGNPDLTRKLSDPMFVEALSEFQSHPQEAIKKYRNNHDIQTFLKDFCGILGDHFTNLGDGVDHLSGLRQGALDVVHPPAVRIEREADANNTFVNEAAGGAAKLATSEEKQLLEDPEIRDALMDPQIQQLIEVLHKNPDRAQSMLHQGDVEMKRKVRKLLDAGLLSFQM